ncbi:PRC-barrel domain-containing protein [Pseudobacteroides cellulosolvens]|uniref:PRC-barrel domain protein n=1 Tax=Pseudobacteroides cellulosolvens ATCC 35603 = DSM 2933 TaxID=398512 RepID=A0A0L6JMS2_9FIRM|nr:PRC-barrel domain-containing protein [Pseudobacteroides cellulosolvens]KNY27096.1 PRC-barrel domain protein [Pseudobacteroides cellulosolvens ATCC 35603 = DSM 2933]
MKKTQEVLGLPIISISDGVEVGKVKSILVNAIEGTVDYIVVDSGIQILSARVISTSSVLGMGEYALTIENDSAINDIGRIPAAIDLLQKNIQVKGSKVLTKKGRLIGEIGDFYFDEDNNCRITGLEYIADITHKKVRIIPRNNVITFGKNLIVVTEDVESKLLDNLSQLSSGEGQPENEKKNSTTIDNVSIKEDVKGISKAIDELTADIDGLLAKEGDTFFKEAQESNTNVNEDNSLYTSAEVPENNVDRMNQPLQSYIDETDLIKTEETESFMQEEITVNEEVQHQTNMDQNVKSSTNQGYANTNSELKTSTQSLFEQRQKQYLNGRKATKTITDNAGKVIVSSGEIINEDMIDIAKNNGKLIELVMNNKA